MAVILKRMIISSVILTLVLVSLLATPAPVSAGAFIRVNTNRDLTVLDSTHCTLRWAVIAANTDARYGGCPAGIKGTTDQIFVPGNSDPYILSIVGDGENSSKTGDLDILTPMDISGQSPASTQITGYSFDRVFHIKGAGKVSIGNMKIYGGDKATAGGGIMIESATVKLYSLVIDNNHATQAGGGIKISPGAVVTINSSTISNNTAPQAGGILNEGTLIITNSLIRKNQATSQNGGLDNNPQGTGYAKVTNTIITENISPKAAAGVSVTGKIDILNSDIVNNDGIGLQVGSGITGTIKNSIISQTGTNCVIASTVFVSTGHNIENQNTCKFKTTSGDMISVPDATIGLSGTLALNGGKTLNYALLDGSVAIDAGDNNGCALTDQRLRGRPADGNGDGTAQCDIGAYEVNGNIFFTYLPQVKR